MTGRAAVADAAAGKKVSPRRLFLKGIIREGFKNPYLTPADMKTEFRSTPTATTPVGHSSPEMQCEDGHDTDPSMSMRSGTNSDRCQALDTPEYKAALADASEDT